jgi:flagellar hook-associated protein 2
MSISVGGLVSGLDINGMISQLLEVQRRPIAMLQQQEAAYQVELTAYGSLKGELANLKSALEGLDDVSDMTVFKATVGDADFISVSAGQQAAQGSYNLTVTQMADVHKLTSSAFAAAEAVGQGTLHIKVGAGSVVDIAVSATDTIDDVAQAINDAEAGVNAGVIFDGTNYFLALTGEETGVDSVINVTATDNDTNDTDASGLSRLVFDKGVIENLTNTQDATDAIITVDGVVDIHRSTNVIDDVIAGITITIASAPAAPDNQAALTVSRNTAATVAKIDTFVAAFNSLVEFFDTYQQYDATAETAGILQGDATTNGIRNRLSRSITGTVAGVDGFSRLVDLGISLDSDGKLETDSAALTTALDEKFDDVLQFFSQDTEGSPGFAVGLIDTLEGMLSTTLGALAARTKGIQTSIDHIGDQVERMELRNQAWEARTRAQFNSLELLLAEYQTTGNYLTQQIAGLQNLNNYVANKG